MKFFDQIRAILPVGRVNIAKRFALQRKAISGTMSTFYMARDLTNDQIVGLKILDKKKSAAFDARFRGMKKPCEGKIAMLFAHPHIVRTLEYGTTTTGEQFLVMEFIEGAGLNSLLTGDNPALQGNRFRIIREAAEAILAVHSAGYIHRDICPRNFMLTEKGLRVKLIDFGLSVPATPPFQQPGIRTGTPNYMAPEIVRRKPTDKRLDVFAFGVTAYEICTGELPWFSGETGMAAMRHDTMPPRDIRELRPQINPTLAKAIHACIEPDVKRRCRSMDAFLAMIRGVESEDQLEKEPHPPRKG